MNQTQKVAYTAKEVEVLYGLDYQTLANWRSQGKGPRYVKAGARRVLYRRTDLDKWMEANLVQTMQ